MASSRESRRSNAGRLIAASVAAASLDARAHGGAGFEWIAIPFLIGVAGIAATLVVHLVCGGSAFPRRLFESAGLAAIDVGLWLSLGWVFFFLASSTVGVFSSENNFKTLVVAVGFIPWIVPVVLLVRWWRQR